MPSKQIDINKIISILKKETKDMPPPIVTAISTEKSNRMAFKVLISTVLSLRTKDDTTEKATSRLFAKADSPKTMIHLTAKQIEKLIYPVGFYKTKAETILTICHRLLDKYHGIVPNTVEELVTFKGVGRKTANLTVTLGWGLPAICVDTHVHRILNRIGYVSTKTPDETEIVLRDILPKRHWIIINDLLVMYGQNLCRPISPYCGRCKLINVCSQIGVTTTRN